MIFDHGDFDVIGFFEIDLLHFQMVSDEVIGVTVSAP
ncbi:Uncharacterised protein [Vibrio cholerae]|nr:Uncharacterised protein [Vibrio cholerae]